ncbi:MULTISPECIES: DUF6708 domain-containing protein [unclassified Cobetia]|uniref:DUF6708 domain-containing protein n=1 Tax=unclassified Cobetia TaxID=2609414 RepID=UPI00178C8536|nr:MULTISPECIES: DUF6708 domain-containing protein [unclassified Cobetia]MBE2167848.1 hypothetical protein [Cobetia sp. 2AS1]MDH2446272.1 hypothetical protein [Cobetia sp. 2AS]
MNFLGLEKNGFFALKLNRKISREELSSKLDKNIKASTSPHDNLNIIQVNSCYLEIIDSWFVHKGIVTFAGGCFLLYLSLVLAMMTYGAVASNDPAAKWFLMMVVFFHLPIFYIAFRLLSLEIFQKTYYPIRFDKINKKIYAILPKNRFIEVDWDKAFVFFKKTRQPFSISHSESYHYEICVHILSDDRKKVLQTFTLGSFSETKADAINFWEFVRLYMEDDSSLDYLVNKVSYYLPIKNKTESFRLSIVLVMAPISGMPISQLIVSPISSLFVLGRKLSIITSKAPKWPEDVMNNEVSKEYSYVDKNTHLSFLDTTWPFVCFIFGLSVTTLLMLWGLKALYYSL